MKQYLWFFVVCSVLFPGSMVIAETRQLVFADQVKEYSTDPSQVIVAFTLSHPMVEDEIESITLYGDGRLVWLLPNSYLRGGRYEKYLDEQQIRQMLQQLEKVQALPSTSTSDLQLNETDQPQISLQLNSRLISGTGREKTPKKKSAQPINSAAVLQLIRTVVARYFSQAGEGEQ